MQFALQLWFLLNELQNVHEKHIEKTDIKLRFYIFDFDSLKSYTEIRKCQI